MDKLQQYLKTELDTLRQKGIFNRPRVLESEQKATVIVDGREVITLSSNNPRRGRRSGVAQCLRGRAGTPSTTPRRR